MVAMFEFDSPELKEAVISTLRDPDPQTAISPDQFFSTHLGDGATVTPFDDILHTFDSAYRDVVGASGVESLTKEMQTFDDLVGACQASPHKEIRAELSSFIHKATITFLQRALAMTPIPESEDAWNFQFHWRMLKERGPGMGLDHVFASLLSACKMPFPAEIRMSFHALGLGMTVNLDPSEGSRKAYISASFATVLRGLPVDDQLRAFRHCLSVDEDAPDDGLRAVKTCLLTLDKFNHEVGGKAAIELVKAASLSANRDLLRQVLTSIEKMCIRRDPHSNAGKSYFDSVPADDRIEYFVSSMEALLDAPGFSPTYAAFFGKQIVDKILPDRMIDLAKDALRRADKGEKVDFRSEAKHWQT
jgi:hypothetical protein